MNSPPSVGIPQSKRGSHLPVSVIIPAYNYAQYLREAIDSVLAQTYPAVTCIVVDDGSTDDTATVATQYGNRIRYIYQQNQGLAASRTNGMRLAQTPLVAFLDADDRLQPTFVERLVAVLAGGGERLAVAACATEYIDERGVPWSRQRPRLDTHTDITLPQLLCKTRFSADAVVARRDALLACGGFDPALRSSEDRDMWIRVAQAGHRIRWIPEPLLQVRKHGQSMSRNPERMMENGLRVLTKARAGQHVPPWRFDYWNRFFAFHAYESAWSFHDAGQRSRAVRLLLRSLCLWPLPFPHCDLGEPVLFRLRALRRFVWRRHSGGMGG